MSHLALGGGGGGGKGGYGARVPLSTNYHVPVMKKGEEGKTNAKCGNR